MFIIYKLFGNKKSKTPAIKSFHFLPFISTKHLFSLNVCVWVFYICLCMCEYKFQIIHPLYSLGWLGVVFVKFYLVLMKIYEHFKKLWFFLLIIMILIHLFYVYCCCCCWFVCEYEFALMYATYVVVSYSLSGASSISYTCMNYTDTKTHRNIED